MTPESLTRPTRADLTGVIEALDRLIDTARTAAESGDDTSALTASDIVGVTPLADLVGACLEACSEATREDSLDAAFAAQIEGRHRSITDSDLAFRALALCGLANWASGKDLS